MKFINRRFFITSLSLVLLISLTFPQTIQAERIVPGTPLIIGVERGENAVRATFNRKKGSATIYGNGKMADNYNEPTLRWFGGYEKDVKSLVIEDGVTSIGDFAFGGNSQATTKEAFPKLKKITLGNTIQKIGIGAFFGARALKKIEIPSSVETISSYAFKDNLSLSSVKLNEGLKTIGEGAFAGCEKLKTIIIPEGVRVINSDTFHRALTSITLPKSLNEVKEDAFRGIVNATIYSKDAAISENAFPKGSIITCYKDSLTAKSALDRGLTVRYIKEKTSVIKSAPPKVSSKRRKLIIKCATVSNAVGYQIRFSTNPNMKNATTIGKKEYISKKFKVGTTFYVQSRAYDTIIGDKIKGKWSKKVKVVVRR